MLFIGRLECSLDPIVILGPFAASVERGGQVQCPVKGNGGSGFYAFTLLNHINELHRLANLGYWVRTSAAGQGIAPQAVRLVADWAFANTNLQRLEIVVAVGNIRSERVAVKVGALREGLLRSRLYIHDQPHDAVMYSLVRLT